MLRLLYAVLSKHEKGGLRALPFGEKVPRVGSDCAGTVPTLRGEARLLHRAWTPPPGDAVDGTTIIENKNTDRLRQSHIIQVALYAISSNGKYDTAKIIFNNGVYELSKEELALECEKVKDISQKLWNVLVSDEWLDIFND